MMQGWTVSWTNYDRETIVTTLKTNTYVYSILSKIARAARNINILCGNYVDDTFIESPNNPYLTAINRPNAFMSRSEFIEWATMQYMSFGEAFIAYEIYEAGNNRGQIIPGTIQLSPPNITDIEQKNYIPTGYLINGDVTRKMPLDKMVHLKGFNPDYTDMHGLPYLKVAGILVDKLEAANETETKTFQNSGPAHLVSPKDVDSFSDRTVFDNFIDRVRNVFKKNAKGVAGINVPMEVMNLGSTPTDLGTIESQKNTIKVLLTLWGLDPGMFDTDASTYNNKQMMEQTVYTEAAIPFVEKMLEKLNDKFEPYYKAKLVIDTSAIEALQPNYKEKVEWMTIAGKFTGNEIREATGYTKIDDPIMDMTDDQIMNGATVGFENTNEEMISSVAGDVQQTALNGAQIASLLEIVTSVSTGMIPLSSARAVIEASFPTLPKQVIDKIINGLTNFKPTESEA